MNTATRRIPKPDSRAAAADYLRLKSAEIFREHEGALLRELQHRVHTKIEAELRKRAIYLSFPLTRVLFLISTEPGISGAQLARRCSVKAQSMNGLLMPLEKAGLIERSADPENARVLKCYALPAGVTLMQRAMAAAHRVVEPMINVLTARERNELRRLLRKCINVIDIEGGGPLVDERNCFEKKARRTAIATRRRSAR